MVGSASRRLLRQRMTCFNYKVFIIHLIVHLALNCSPLFQVSVGKVVIGKRNSILGSSLFSKWDLCSEAVCIIKNMYNNDVFILKTVNYRL